MVEVTIDRGSGFCFGVVKAIQSAERELKQTDELYSLGDLVHNSLALVHRRRTGRHQRPAQHARRAFGIGSVHNHFFAHFDGKSFALRIARRLYSRQRYA